jgi:tight adherence protein B
VKLTASGIEMGPGDFMGVLCGVALGAFALVNATLSGRLAVLAGPGAVWGVFLWVRRKRDQRRDRFVAQLPELARVLSNAASAGLATRTAVEMAATELDDPAGSELRRVSDELRIGQSVDVALVNLERRMPSREVAVLVGTLVIQHRAGGSLITALRDMSHTLEARQDLRREVRTIMAGSVYTSYVVVIMGLGSLLLVNSMSPGVLDKMTSRPLGQAALGLAAALYAVGFLLIRRTTRIET